MIAIIHPSTELQYDSDHTMKCFGLIVDSKALLDGKKMVESQYNKILVEVWGEFVQGGLLHQYHKDQYLFYQGHQPYGVFVVVSGKVLLVSQDQNGNKIEIAAKPFNPIGFDILNYNSSYPFSAVVCSEACVIFVPKSSLDQLSERTQEGAREKI